MSYAAIAALVQATMRGLVVLTPLVPSLAETRHRADPVGVGETSEWSLPALGIATTIAAHLEPDPEIEWTPDHVAEVRTALSADPFAPLAQ